MEILKTSEFAELQREAWQTCEDKGFHEPRIREGVLRKVTPMENLALIAGEVGEAIGDYQKYADLSVRYEPTSDVSVQSGLKPEGVPVELADVVIRILEFCENYEIDFYQVLRMKMDYNKTRPRMHGKKM